MMMMYQSNKLLLALSIAMLQSTVEAVHTATVEREDNGNISKDGEKAEEINLMNILPLITPTLASSILKVAFIVIGAVLYLAHSILFKLDHVTVGDSLNQFLIESTGACMFATGVFATLVPLISTSDHNGWVVVPDVYVAYGWAAAIFPIAYVQWYFDGTIQNAGLDTITVLTTFLISIVAVYTGFVLQSKQVICGIVVLFAVQAIISIVTPRLLGKLWAPDETEVETKVALTRTSGFFLLCMEIQFYLILIQEMTDQPNKVLGYATIPVIPYMLTTLFMTPNDKKIQEFGLQKFGHIISLCVVIVCIVSLVVDDE